MAKRARTDTAHAAVTVNGSSAAGSGDSGIGGSRSSSGGGGKGVAGVGAPQNGYEEAVELLEVAIESLTAMQARRLLLKRLPPPWIVDKLKQLGAQLVDLA
jgi:hypothetical protein